MCAGRRGGGVRGGEWGGGGKFEHPRLAEDVPNYLVAFYDTRSESSGKFYYPLTRREREREREV